MMILAIYFAMTILIASLPVETEDIPLSVSEIKAEHGDKVTLNFRVMKKDDKFDWYKQSHGYVPQTVARRVLGIFFFFPPFNLTFTMEEGVSDFNLIIQSVTKGDEANYFCRQQFSDSWTNGIFLSVKDKNVMKVDEKQDETDQNVTKVNDKQDVTDQNVTKVNDKQDVTEPYRHLVISVHRIMLACCLLVIIILILIIHYRTGKTDSLNYAALDLSGRGNRRREEEK